MTDWHAILLHWMTAGRVEIRACSIRRTRLQVENQLKKVPAVRETDTERESGGKTRSGGLFGTTENYFNRSASRGGRV